MDGNSVGDNRLMRAIETGVPVPGTAEQAAELVAQENVSAARMARSAEAASTSRWLADRRATVRADADRYMLTDRPGVPVFDGVLNRMMPSSRAKVWAREELMGSDYDGVHDDVVAEHLKAIANTLETGDLPDWVESDSRRGCCGATFRTECDDEGTTYFCRLCGKEQEP